jgi:hypothetical protein
MRWLGFIREQASAMCDSTCSISDYMKGSGMFGRSVISRPESQDFRQREREKMRQGGEGED